MNMRALVSRPALSPLRVPASSRWFIAVLLGATAAAISSSLQDDEVIKPGSGLKERLIRHEVTIPHDAENPEQDHDAESEKHEFLESAFPSSADLHKEAAPNGRPPDHADHDDVGAATNTSSSLVVRSSSCPFDTQYGQRVFCVNDGGGKCTRQPAVKPAEGQIKNDGTGNDFDYGQVKTTSKPVSFQAGDCYYQGRLWYSTDVHWFDVPPTQPGGPETCRKACDRVAGCTHYSHVTDPNPPAVFLSHVFKKQTDHCMLFNKCKKVTVLNLYDWPFYGARASTLNNAKVYACTKLCPTNCGAGYTNKNPPVVYYKTSSDDWKDECCDIRSTCNSPNIDCADEGHWKYTNKPSRNSLYCDENAGNNCDKNYCCDRQKKCSSILECSSTAGWTPKDNKDTLLCAANSCTEAECCDQLQSCEGVCVKSAGWVAKTKLFCDILADADTTCSAADCCDQIEDCSIKYGTHAKCNETAGFWISKYPVAEAADGIQNENDVHYCGITNATYTCTQQECCVGVCNTSLCADGQQLVSNHAEIRCDAAQCEASKCCESKPEVAEKVVSSGGNNTSDTAEAAGAGEPAVPVVVGAVTAAAFVFYLLFCSDGVEQPGDAARGNAADADRFAANDVRF